MKYTIFLLFSIAMLAACTSSETTEEQGHKALQQYTIEQFMDNIGYGGAAFSPDENTILVNSNETGITNVYEYPLDGGSPKMLTRSDDSPIYEEGYLPDGSGFMYRQDNNGDEIYHLFIQATDGTILEVTPDSNATASFFRWAKDKESFFYTYNNRNPQYFDLLEYDLKEKKSRLIYQNDGGYSIGDLSRNERYIVLTKAITTDISEMYLYDIKTETNKKISTASASYIPTDFDLNNEYLYFLTNADNEFNYLKRLNIATLEEEEVLKKDWDIVYAYFSEKGNYQVLGINEDGKTVVEIKDMATGKLVDFPTFESGSITGVNISESEEKIAFYVGSSSSPSDLYVFDFASKDYQKLTNALNKEIDPQDLVTAEVVRFPSTDDLKIPAIYYKPKQASANNKVPALVWVHGGPGGQSRQSYSPLLQYLVNHGYAVLAVNNRGSSGYGKTFYGLDDQKHGEGDLMDCVKGKEWLASQEYIDENKIGIIGGSYGGFMVMAAMVHQPEVFDVGVNIYGVTNWKRTLRSIPPWWGSFKDALYQEMGDPFTTDSVRMNRISPLLHADRIMHPVMVLQGAKDPRVLQIESDEMVAAIKANNVPVDYVLFEDEGHGFRKKENQVEAFTGILGFLEKYLKNKEIKG